MTTISYAITACNEHVELERLLKQLTSSIRKEDEIIVQVDSMNVTEEVRAVITKYLDKIHHAISFSLMNDFASFKNNLKKHCTKDYIFQIDADEYLSEELLLNLPPILDLNPDINVFAVSRINTVEGLTQEHINKWGWRVDEKGWVNYPDFQTRIFKNIPELYWIGKVHERIVNNSQGVQALPEGYGLDLIHPKTIERQEKQNAYYSTL